MCLPEKTYPEIFGENLERCCTRARKFLPYPFKIKVLQNEKSLHGYMIDQCLAKTPHSKSASGSGARSTALPSRSGTLKKHRTASAAALFTSILAAFLSPYDVSPDGGKFVINPCLY